MPKRDNISMSVIRRLPRYYRFLSELKDNGVVRISSRELSDKMGFTASQIRQDLNCFGGFGQQGYGYIAEQLYNEIGNILGLSNRFNAILIGEMCIRDRSGPASAESIPAFGELPAPGRSSEPDGLS